MLFSLKKLSKTSLFIAFILIILVIVGNFIVMPIANKYVDENQYLIDTISSTYKDLGYQFSVLNNIHETVNRSNTQEISNTMANAYIRNLEKTIVQLDYMQSQLDDLNSNLQTLKNISLPLRSSLITDAQNLIIDMNAKIYEFDVSKLNNYDLEYMQQLLTCYDGSQTILNSLVQKEIEINSMISNDITLIVNVLIISLLLQLSFYAYMTFHLANNKLNLLIQTLHIIANQDYENSHLPKQKIRFTEDVTIKSSIERVLAEGHFTKRLTQTLTSCYEVDDLMESLFQLVKSKFDLDRIGIAFVDYQNKKFIAEYGTMNYGNIKLGPGFEVGFHETSLISILNDKTTIINQNLDTSLKKKPKSKALDLLSQEGIISNMTIPVLMNGRVFGLVFFSSKKRAHFKDSDKIIGEKIVNSISSLLIRAYFTKVVLNKVTSSFSQLVDQKDNDTGEHLERMTIYSLIVARGLKLHQKAGYSVSDKFLLELERNASAHDIGKVGIPDNILKKPGKLTPKEWEIMKTHTSIGADIFSDLRESLHLFGDDFFHYAEIIARYHHEKWDGSGYPEGLSGTSIPLAARIVAIGDVFDALTSKRVYKNAFSFEDSVATLVDGKGQHFDPFLIEVFLEQLDDIKEVYLKK